MNDLYIHQLETENKQLREALKEEREKNNKAIEYIKQVNKYGVLEDTYAKDLLEILGDKE